MGRWTRNRIVRERLAKPVGRVADRHHLDRPLTIVEVDSQLEPKRSWSGRSTDVSGSGMGLISEYDVMVGSMLMINVHGDDEPKTVLGEVRRCEPGEHGSCVLGITFGSWSVWDATLGVNDAPV